jgi:hypothetical protein
MRNRRARRLAIVLSAAEVCELVPDIPIMPNFRIIPLKWEAQAAAGTEFDVSTRTSSDVWRPQRFRMPRTEKCS